MLDNNECNFTWFWAAIAQSVLRLVTDWTVRGSNPGGGEIFRTRPDRPWGPPSLLYNGYQVSFPGVKRSGRGVDHPPSSSARVKERVELYLYSPSRPSWPFLGRTLPLLCMIPTQVLHRDRKLRYIISRCSHIAVPVESGYPEPGLCVAGWRM
jgi:hypothetical protein